MAQPCKPSQIPIKQIKLSCMPTTSWLNALPNTRIAFRHLPHCLFKTPMSCGQEIKEHCYIRNSATGHNTYVRNVCIRRFLKIDTGCQCTSVLSIM
ncbi:hypothetical protein Bpro_1547 [Polaromonas sp. JS666]|nr:hypothetical protein Bpro_1547 [Polaromonas sp. JS666]